MTVSLTRSPSLNLNDPEAVRAEIKRAEEALARARHLEKTKKEIVAVRGRCKSFYGFIQEAWHVLEPTTPFKPNWHIKLICEVLEAITFGKLVKAGLRNRVIFNVPPGTMKSLLISVLWNAWEWTLFPSRRFLSSSYSLTYVTRDTRKTRDLVTSEWYQLLWGDAVKTTRARETSFGNDKTGSREGIPYGSLTSGRGDRVTIDDPNSTEQAESDADRARAIRITRESLQSRVNDPIHSAIVVIQQRLHPDDVTGTLEGLNIGYIVVRLPMMFEVKNRFELPELGLADPREREGELLFPQHMPKAWIEIEKIPLGSFGVAGQWQQRPSPRGGGMFQRGNFPIVGAMPPGRYRRLRAWDLAASAVKKPTDRPDWTVGLPVSRNLETGIFYVERPERFQSGPGTVKKNVKNVSDQDRARWGGGYVVRMTQDPGQAGKDQAETYLKLLAGHSVVMKLASGDKRTRATPAAAQVEAGLVFLVRTGDPALDAWIDIFLDEVCAFNRGAHDDQVDALADAINELALGESYLITDSALA